MKRSALSTGASSYEILVASGLLAQAGQLLKEQGLGGKSIIVTNPVVRDFYGSVLLDSLACAGFEAGILEVPDGEEQKSLKVAGRLYSQLSRLHAERSTVILALGGGVIGDLAGFVAATYMRGLPLVQVPTTLLAQVDSSIGGKVAVNHGRLKNVIGAFYQPRLVVSDILTLKTLGAREVGDGLAEVIKYGVIRDRELFRLVEDNIDRIRLFDGKILEEIVSLSAGIKAEVVEKDEKDLGIRNILNFGHTVGHAIEAVSGFDIAHGSAVALGMIAAGRIANKMGLIAEGELMRLQNIIRRAGLPVKLPPVNIARVMQAMSHDKKVRQGRIRFVLPRALGDVFVTDEVSTELIEEVLRSFNAEA